MVPRWLWPRTVHGETTAVIRLGRAVHWLGVVVGAGLGALLVAMSFAFEAYLHPDFPGTLALTLALPIGGRVARYILADE